MGSKRARGNRCRRCWMRRWRRFGNRIVRRGCCGFSRGGGLCRGGVRWGWAKWRRASAGAGWGGRRGGGPSRKGGGGRGGGGGGGPGVGGGGDGVLDETFELPQHRPIKGSARFEIKPVELVEQNKPLKQFDAMWWVTRWIG